MEMTEMKDIIKVKTKALRPRWIKKGPGNLTIEHNLTFQEMRAREMSRRDNGPKLQTSKWIIIFFIAVAVLSNGHEATRISGENVTFWSNNFLTFSIGVTLIIFACILVVILILGCINNKYRSAVHVLVLYLPCTYFLGSVVGLNEKDSVRLLIADITLASLVIVWTICKELLYPKIVRSRWFHEKFNSRSVKLIGEWTMAYRGRLRCWGRVYTCKYDGETNEAGLPHGSGRWFDDSHDGEILTGQWAEGVPVAPFRSRTYGKGDGFVAVQIAYFIARDDGFVNKSSNPSNENPPQIGMASVECSVSGDFYAHLPLATVMIDPIVVDSEGGTVANICKQMVHFNGENKKRGEGVEISMDSSRRLQVIGHVYTPPDGSLDSEAVEQVTVDVTRQKEDCTPFINPAFMPRVSSTRSQFNPLKSSKILNNIRCLYNIAEENSIISDDECKEVNTKEEESVELKEDNTLEEEEGRCMPMKPVSIENEEGMHRNIRGHKRESLKVAKLEVRNWTRTQHTDALIYFGGFKTIAKDAVQHLGQFLALTSVSHHVFPIVYAYPAGSPFSYRSASNISASQKNKDNFLVLLRGLSEAGIQNVHFMSHSMGSQSLLAMFEDKFVDNTPSRSDVSLMFRQDPTFEDDTEYQGNGKPLMVCKNIILMNPDFPVEAFVDRAFLSIRRVCHNITVLGDTKDFALNVGSRILNTWYSKIRNRQSHLPHLLQSNKSLQSDSAKFKYLSLGRDIDLLYVPQAQKNMYQEQEPLNIQYSKERLPLHKSLLFDGNQYGGAPSIVFTHDDQDDEVEDSEKEWLDIDIIDTTTLDTNMAGIRHSGFCANPIILNDLEELILGGQRASHRSSLLHRDGNIFTYSHAPSHIIG